MLLRHLLGYVPAHAAHAIASFGGVVVLTRLLAPGEYGRYTLVLSAISFIHQLVFTWLEAAIARRYAAAEAEGKVDAELATAYAAFAVIAAALVVAAAGLILFAPLADDMRTLLALGAGVLLVQSALKLGLEARRAARQVGRYVAIDTTQTLGGFLLGVAFVLMTDLREAGPLAGVLVASGACLLVDLPSMLGRARAGTPSPERARLMFGYGLAVSLSLALEQTLAVADRFLIAGFINEAATGVYAAGYALGNRTLDIIFVWGGMTAAPLTFAALESGGAGKAREIALKYASTIVLITFPAAAGLALVANPLAEVMVGEDFRTEAKRIIPWIAAGGLMNGIMTYYFHEQFLLAKRSGRMAAAMVVPAVGNVILNIILLPRVGLMGAVWATVAAYAAGLLICGFWGRRYFALPVPFKTAGLAALGCAVMALIIRAMPVTPGGAAAELALKVGAGALAYAVFALAVDLGGCRSWVSELRGKSPQAGAP